MRVKICGITNLEDALVSCEAGADALGFNFAEEARIKNRYIEPDSAHQIIAQLPPFVTTVAICVNAPLSKLQTYLGFVDYVQLHGDESRDLCRPIAAKAIKAFPVDADFEPICLLEYPAAAYLLDAKTPGARGGAGITCDWDAAAAAVDLGRPIILAGGLTPENVQEAIRRVRPHAVDTASGVETAPGVKDHDRIRRFIHNAKTSLS